MVSSIVRRSEPNIGSRGQRTIGTAWNLRRLNLLYLMDFRRKSPKLISDLHTIASISTTYYLMSLTGFWVICIKQLMDRSIVSKVFLRFSISSDIFDKFYLTFLKVSVMVLPDPSSLRLSAYFSCFVKNDTMHSLTLLTVTNSALRVGCAKVLETRICSTCRWILWTILSDVISSLYCLEDPSRSDKAL